MVVAFRHCASPGVGLLARPRSLGAASQCAEACGAEQLKPTRDEAMENLVEQQEQVELVRYVLSQLSPDYAALLAGKYLDGQTIDELASEFGSTIDAVKSKLARART